MAKRQAADRQRQQQQVNPSQLRSPSPSPQLTSTREGMIGCVMALEAALPARELQAIDRSPHSSHQSKRKKNNFVITEAYPESEYNPSRDVLDGESHVTIDDLVESLQGKSGYSQLRKRTHQMGIKASTLQAPLPKGLRDNLERKAAYEKSKKDMTKWEPLVKRNREAPTIIFDKDIDLGFSTVGAIASEFEPRTEFEKKIAALVHDDKVMEAHKEDGARLLELNKISLEDFRNQRNHIAKMRSLLFCHEMKLKRIKKIKSKTYRRLSKKERLKLGSAQLLMDPEAAKEQAMKQEFKRAEERMTLRHKNRSKWAKRILERGLDAQDEGTRAAMAEQLNEHTRLTRKMNSMRDTSGSDDSSEDDDDGDSTGSDHDKVSKVLTKAKERTLKILEEDNEVTNSGVMSLPFMVRGMKRKEEAAIEEAKLAVQEYESSLKQSEETNGAENNRMGLMSGRMIFGTPLKTVTEKNKMVKRGVDDSENDSEREIEAEEDLDATLVRNDVQKDVIDNDHKTPQDSTFESFDDIGSNPGPKTTYEVSILVSDTWKKMTKKEADKDIKISSKGVETDAENKDLEEVNEESDTDSEEMVDGVLSSSPKASYKLPSQEELIRQAFAGDYVEEDFAKEKEEILNDENPEPEKPVLLPGWGQWTHVQKKKGLPSWMLEEHEIAKKRRDEALKKRKDAHLKHVIISEKLDKKAEKLHTKTLPYPFTSKEVFEQSIRMPIGPEFNPATAVGALNRPEVLKRPGVIIKPVKFEDVDPYEKSDDHKRGIQKQKPSTKRKQSKLKAVVAKS